MTRLRMAPEWSVREWIGEGAPESLASLRGRVVVVEVFQMLCPGCVSRALPQAMQIAALYPRSEVVVLGLHSVFEHHAVQGSRAALDAFLHEYRLGFPVAIDAPSAHGAIPQTMARYRMQGTPTQLLIDRAGRLRKQRFGVDDPMRVGAEITALLGESDVVVPREERVPSADERCDENGCAIPDGTKS